MGLCFFFFWWNKEHCSSRVFIPTNSKHKYNKYFFWLKSIESKKNKNCACCKVLWATTKHNIKVVRYSVKKWPSSSPNFEISSQFSWAHIDEQKLIILTTFNLCCLILRHSVVVFSPLWQTSPWGWNKNMKRMHRLLSKSIKHIVPRKRFLLCQNLKLQCVSLVELTQTKAHIWIIRNWCMF